jgi:hypothetical protein
MKKLVAFWRTGNADVIDSALLLLVLAIMVFGFLYAGSIQ